MHSVIKLLYASLDPPTQGGDIAIFCVDSGGWFRIIVIGRIFSSSKDFRLLLSVKNQTSGYTRINTFPPNVGLHSLILQRGRKIHSAEQPDRKTKYLLQFSTKIIRHVNAK